MTSLREDLDLLHIPLGDDEARRAFWRLWDFLGDFEKVAELGEKATPGAWRVTHKTEIRGSRHAFVADTFDESRESADSAAFIVAARNFVGKWGKK